MQAIILAGGKGSRLKPFTTNIPKPLMPVDDLPILEIVLRQLKYYGFKDVVMAVNHLAELIMAFFQKGERIKLNITYSLEEKPLSTAGPIALVDHLDENFLVMNGDLLTTINYKDLFDFHVKYKNDITISTYKKEIKIDLGVLKLDGSKFIDYIEKPTYSFDVSMGIYIMNRKVVDLIPKNESMDMPSLILKARDKSYKVECYTGNYYWLDIGRVDDYEKASEIFREKRKEFLPNG